MIQSIQNIHLHKKETNPEPKQRDGYFITSKIADDIFVSKEKEASKGKKKYGIIIASSTVGAALLVLGLTKGLPKNTHNVLKKHLQYAKKNTDLGMEKVQEFLKKGVEKAQSINNFNAFKDILFLKVMQKSEFTRNIHSHITKFFEKMAQNTVFSGYKSVDNKIKNLNKFFAKSNLPEEKLSEISGKVANLSESFGQKFSPQSVKLRFRGVTSDWENLSDEVLKRSLKDLEGLKDKSSIKEGVQTLNDADFSNVFIAEDVLAVTKDLFAKSVSEHKGSFVKELDELLLSAKDSLTPNQYRKLVNKVNSIKTSLNKAAHTEAYEYFDKVRDLRLGSAPTDIITMLTSVGTVAIGLSKADTKDERISAALKFGIPVLGSVFSSVLLTISLVSGFKAIAIGTALGLGMSVLGEKIDIIRKKHNKQKENEQHAAKVKEDIANKNNNIEQNSKENNLVNNIATNA